VDANATPLIDYIFASESIRSIPAGKFAPEDRHANFAGKVGLRSRMCARKSHSERRRGRTTLSSGRGSSSTLRRFSARSPPLASASPIEMSPGMRARPQQAEGLRACCVDLIKRQLGWLIKSGRVEGSSPPAGQFRWRGGGSELSCSVGRGPAECKDGRSARIAVEGRNEGCSGRKEDFGERAPRPKMFFGVASMCC